MEMTKFDISALGEYKEGNRVEAKKAGGGIPGSMWETYSSFANTDGGIIVLGVEEMNDGRLVPVGVKDPDKMVKEIWNAVNNPQKVSINILMNKDVHIEEVEEKRIIIVEVPRADRSIRPVYVGQNPLSGSYRRNGEGDYHCTKEEVTAMYRDASRISQDQKVMTGKDVSAFCMDTVHSYRNLFNIVHRNHVWTKLDDETFLFKLGAIDYDDEHRRLHPTAAGLLMFGYENELMQEYPQYFLDYQEHKNPSIRWTDRKISSSGDWSGNLFDFFFSIADKLTADLPHPFKLDGMLRVDDTPLHKAVREALLNTLVNADYYGRRGVVVTKSREGFTFSNPGDFRISMNEAISGGVSDPRNAIVFKMFNLVDLGERAGSGLPTIYNGWEEAYGERPTLSESHDPDRVTLTLHCDNIDHVTFETDDKRAENDRTADKSVVNNNIGGKSAVKIQNTDDKRTINSSMDDKADDKRTINSSIDDKADDKRTINSSKDDKADDKRSQIVTYIKEHGQANVSSLSAALGVSTSQTKRYVYQLVSEGKIVPHGANRNRTYSLRG